jgi:hypothetical protein
MFQLTHCYQCWPGGPVTPPPCIKCGSTTLYYSAGMCQRCLRAPQVVGSCLDCHCWGVTRTTKWLCEGCRGWRRRFPFAARCSSCRRTIAVNADGFCRLCWRQSVGERPHGSGLSVVEANQHGQHLFFADWFRQKRQIPSPASAPRRGYRQYPVTYHQLSLIELARDLAHGQRCGFSDPPDPQFAELLDQTAHEHARGHGWSKTRRNDARKGIRILLSLQDTPGAVIKASEVAQLDQVSLAVQPILDILASAGMLDDDRQPALIRWFARQVAGLARTRQERAAHLVHRPASRQYHPATIPPESRDHRAATCPLRPACRAGLG